MEHNHNNILKSLHERCLRLFETKHGERHDKWFYSARCYDHLIDVFSDETRFDIYGSSLTFWDKNKKSGSGLSLDDYALDDTIEYIIHKIEYEVLRSMYDALQTTRKRRFERMRRYVKAEYSDLCYTEFLRTFVEYCTREHLHRKDYADFVAEVEAYD